MFWSVLVMKHTGKLSLFQFFFLISCESEYWLGELGWSILMTFPNPHFPSIKWASWSYPHDLSCHLISLAGQAGPGRGPGPPWGLFTDTVMERRCCVSFNCGQRDWFWKKWTQGSKLEFKRQNWIVNPWRWGEKGKSRCKTHMKENKE